MSKIVTKGARQGDIMIIAQGIIPRIDVRDSGLSPSEAVNGRQIVALGEATGHHHSFPMRQGMMLFRDTTNAPVLFVTDGAAPLEHQEHSTITFAPSQGNPDGKFNVLRQRTYHAGMARRVID